MIDVCPRELQGEHGACVDEGCQCKTKPLGQSWDSMGTGMPQCALCLCQIVSFLALVDSTGTR